MHFLPSKNVPNPRGMQQFPQARRLQPRGLREAIARGRVLNGPRRVHDDGGSGFPAGTRHVRAN